MKFEDFEVIGQVTDIETIAVGRSIRILPYLERKYGKGRWRKLKGKAMVTTSAGRVRYAEIHWYEAHGIGRRGGKVKQYLD